MGRISTTLVSKWAVTDPFLDAVLDVGPDTVLDATPQLGAPVHQGDMSPRAEELERRLDRGVLPTDDDDLLAVVRVRLGVVVRDVRQIFAGDPEHVWTLVGADRHHHRARQATGRTIMRMPSLHRQQGSSVGSRRAPDSPHLESESHVQVVGVGGASIVAERLVTRRLRVRSDEREPANLEPLGRGEEHHVGGETQDRVDQRRALDHLIREPRLVRCDRAGQPGGTRPDDDDVLDPARVDTFLVHL